MADLSLQIPAISSGPFIATPTGLVVENGKGPVDYELWHAYGQGLRRVESAIQWVIGDWLNYGERAYGETYSQALALWPEYEYDTLRKYGQVAERIQIGTRVPNLSWSHHREVAFLAPEEQGPLLDRSVENDWNVRDLRQAVREYQNGIRREAGTLVGAGTYSVIYADPPWRYDFTLTSNRAIENQYPTMEVEEICALPVADIAAPDSVLFLWATSPKLPQALQVMGAWGFDYRTCMVWVKDKIGMGYYARQQHELLLIGAKGELPVPAPADRPPSVVHAPRQDHSHKPEVVYETIERMYPALPKVELFARAGRTGWESWGNQA